MRTSTRRFLSILGLTTLLGAGMTQTPAHGEAVEPRATSPHVASASEVVAFTAQAMALGAYQPTRPSAPQTQAHRNLFTDTGWAGFQAAMNGSGIPAAVDREHVRLRWNPSGPARIVDRTTNAQGQPVWRVSQAMTQVVQRLDQAPITTPARLLYTVVQPGEAHGQPVLRLQAVVMAPTVACE